MTATDELRFDPDALLAARGRHRRGRLTISPGAPGGDASPARVSGGWQVLSATSGWRIEAT